MSWSSSTGAPFVMQIWTCSILTVIDAAQMTNTQSRSESGRPIFSGERLNQIPPTARPYTPAIGARKWVEQVITDPSTSVSESRGAMTTLSGGISATRICFSVATALPASRMQPNRRNDYPAQIRRYCNICQPVGEEGSASRRQSAACVRKLRRLGQRRSLLMASSAPSLKIPLPASRSPLCYSE